MTSFFQLVINLTGCNCVIVIIFVVILTFNITEQFVCYLTTPPQQIPHRMYNIQPGSLDNTSDGDIIGVSSEEEVEEDYESEGC